MKPILKENRKKILDECEEIIKKNPKLKKKKLHLIKDLDKRLYYLKVWFVTESQPLHTLKNYNKRCFKCFNGYHLDHIYSIHEGFKNKIPPEVIGDLKNLRFIPIKQNMRKGFKVTNESKNILKTIMKKKK
jgi:hypothetical protein